MKKCKIQGQVTTLQMPFAYNRKSTNFSSAQVGICVKDATPLDGDWEGKERKTLLSPDQSNMAVEAIGVRALTEISINLLVVYRESVNLIGYLTRRLSADSLQL